MDASAVWARYQSLRLRAALLPLDDREMKVSARAGRRMARLLGLDEPSVTRLARRHVLHRREQRLHESLLLDWAPDELGLLVDAVDATGEELLRPDGGGALLLGLHYGLHSSMLGLWLARSAARGRVEHLTLTVRSEAGGGFGLPDRRLDALADAGLGRSDAVALLDLARVARPADEMLARLRAGETLYVLPDTELLDPADPRAIRIDAPRGAVGIPSGPVWLAHLARVPLRTIAIRGDGGAQRVTLGTVPAGTTGADLASTAREGLQALWDRTVGLDPAQWELWGAPDNDDACASV